MDTYQNPFNPGAGVSPPELAGRADVLEQAVTALERVKRGRHAKSLMLLGLRGVGKTVVLNEISKQALKRGYLAELVEARDGDDLKQMLISVLRKLLLQLDRGERTIDAGERQLSWPVDDNYLGRYSPRSAGCGSEAYSDPISMTLNGENEWPANALEITKWASTRNSGRGSVRKWQRPRLASACALRGASTVWRRCHRNVERGRGARAPIHSRPFGIARSSRCWQRHRD